MGRHAAAWGGMGAHLDVVERVGDQVELPPEKLPQRAALALAHALLEGNHAEARIDPHTRRRRARRLGLAHVPRAEEELP
eukprot:3683902-Prymnesium_polylepis.1